MSGNNPAYSRFAANAAALEAISAASINCADESTGTPANDDAAASGDRQAFTLYENRKHHQSALNALVGGLIIDSFAGGGGASTGIAMALGRQPDIAINHDGEALSMH